MFVFFYTRRRFLIAFFVPSSIRFIIEFFTEGLGKWTSLQVAPYLRGHCIGTERRDHSRAPPSEPRVPLSSRIRGARRIGEIGPRLGSPTIRCRAEAHESGSSVQDFFLPWVLSGAKIAVAHTCTAEVVVFRAEPGRESDASGLRCEGAVADVRADEADVM